MDDNEYFSSLENDTELIVCTGEHIQKLLIYFELKIYLSFKNISHPFKYWLFSIMLKITLMFIEAVISSTVLVLFKVFLIVFTYTLNKR